MSLPNLNNPTKVEGRVATLAITSLPVAIISNSSQNEYSFRINTLSITNITGNDSVSVGVSIFRQNTDYFFGKSISLTADESASVFDRYMYLEPGDSLRLVADSDNKVHAVCSYEIIS